MEQIGTAYHVDAKVEELLVGSLRILHINLFGTLSGSGHISKAVDIFYNLNDGVSLIDFPNISSFEFSRISADDLTCTNSEIYISDYPSASLTVILETKTISQGKHSDSKKAFELVFERNKFIPKSSESSQTISNKMKRLVITKSAESLTKDLCG